MDNQNLIKCKYCNFKTPRWRKDKTGKAKHGNGRLATHVMNNHSEEFFQALEEIQVDIDPNFVEIVNEDFWDLVC